MPQVAAGILSDGRIQVWRIDHHGNTQSRWKLTTDPNAGWTNWSPFSTPPGTVAIATAPLPDGRLHLFLVDEHDRAWAAWKTTTDPNSSWTPWVPF